MQQGFVMTVGIPPVSFIQLDLDFIRSMTFILLAWLFDNGFQSGPVQISKTDHA